MLQLREKSRRNTDHSRRDALNDNEADEDENESPEESTSLGLALCRKR
jgi:hypothetical protein